MESFSTVKRKQTTVPHVELTTTAWHHVVCNHFRGYRRRVCHFADPGLNYVEYQIQSIKEILLNRKMEVIKRVSPLRTWQGTCLFYLPSSMNHLSLLYVYILYTPVAKLGSHTTHKEQLKWCHQPGPQWWPPTGTIKSATTFKRETCLYWAWKDGSDKESLPIKDVAGDMSILLTE